MVSVWEKFNIQHLTFNIITNVYGFTKSLSIQHRQFIVLNGSHSSPEGFSGRPPLRSLPRLSRCRDSRPSRPPLGSQELSLLRCQGMAEGNRLPSLENAPHLKTDGEFFVYHHNGVPTIITNSYTVFYCASSWEYFECWLLYSGTISFIFFTIAMSS